MSWLAALPTDLLWWSAKAALIVAVAFLVAGRLRRTPAAIRHLIWTVAVVAVVAVPLASLAPIEVSLPVDVPATGLAATSTDVRALPLDTPSSMAPGGTTVAARAGTSSLPWRTVGGMVYLLGVAGALLRFGLGLRQARRLRSAASPVADHREWRQTLESIGTVVRADVRVSTEIETPMTFGLAHPTVLLPDGAVSWSPEQRRTTLVHELAHVRRGDYASLVFAHLARAVYWFHPLVRVAVRHLQLEAERACDEHVMRSGADAGDYAQQLLVLTRTRLRAQPPAAVLPMATRSQLSHRVTNILNWERYPMKNHRWIAALALGSVITITCIAPLEPTFAGAGDGAPRGDLSPLMRAAARGDVERAGELIDHGADVDERRRGNGTPLIQAAAAGHARICSMLIEAGADVNRIEGAGGMRRVLRSPLAAAARGGHLDVVALLLEHGARIDRAPEGDATSLMEAAEGAHHRVVELLLERGADVNRTVRGDGSPLIAAARGGDVVTLRILIEAGARVNEGVPGDGNALIVAVAEGNRAAVEYLLAQGADPTAYVPGDENALVKAAEAGDTVMMRLLLDASGRD